MAPGIYIHAGAHRTGTSSFQACLALNRPRLEAAGFDLAYPGRDGAEGGRLALRLPHPRHRKTPDEGWIAGVQDTLGAHMTPGRSMVLSEENIAGRMFHFYQGQFFPAVRRRATVLAAGLPLPLRHVLIVVRPYDALFVSAYRKRAEDNPVPPFGEIAEAMAGIDRGWPAVITAFRRRLRPERLTVIDYALRGESRELLARLLPEGAVTGLEEPGRAWNLSATDTALAALQARYRAGETLARAEWQAVIAEHAEARADLGFARFTPEQAGRLAESYAQDLATIGGMKGVTLIA
ncbi:hypothetical protein GCM10011534_10260 [Pseudooceanicola nanhaiensis]|uniref:Uncharacterized protein n=1 Tax=Pseudooceanicola nanhaiensis TaxID=375761 RepID=A0A917WB12_9RHOB|nr:hypothetical protein [Pseudooceanicola nanhaiensis]GGL90089.1 hypothetical protein GCM10011534_10260 [Pseudooceanicola nanhaiensis]